MIEPIPGLPENVIGFRASGDITKKDYDQVVFPTVSKQLKEGKELNYIFMVDTNLKDFSAGAWVQDIWLGLKDLFKWNRVAIVSDSEKIRSFTDKAGHLIPGTYKGFTKGQLDEAINWAAVGEIEALSR
jgi:stage II sporulation SpoAA-like protein